MQITTIVVLLFALIPTISTLQCYVCNENEETACADESALEKFLQTCDAKLEDPHCRKITQTVDKKTTIVRTCGSKSSSKTCYKTAGKNSANVCSCNTDRCNDASTVRVHQYWMSLVALVISLIFFR